MSGDLYFLSGRCLFEFVTCISTEILTMSASSMSSAIVAILLAYTCLSTVDASRSFGADATSDAESAIRPSEFLRQQQDLVVDLPGAPPVDFKYVLFFDNCVMYTNDERHVY